MSATGLNAVQRRRARRRCVAAAYTFYHQAQHTAVYSQGADRFSGIEKNKRSYRGEYPPASDCSSSSSWELWDCTRRWSLPDFVNGAHWREGYTGTMQEHGRRVFWGQPRYARALMLPGDMVFYGNQGGGVAKHVATYVGGGLVVSHGGPGVHLLPWNYRSDVLEVRRYIR